MVIDACDRKDALKVCDVIAGLIDALNFDYSEIAKSLLRLYEYCMDEVKSGNFDIPLKILKETREPMGSGTRQSSSRYTSIVHPVN